MIDGDVRENLIIMDASSGQQYRFGLPGPSLGDAERGRWLEADEIRGAAAGASSYKGGPR